MPITKTGQANFDFVSDLPADDDKCVFCHDAISSLLTWAHCYHEKERLAHPDQPGINEAYRLCWSCHNGLQHYGLITAEEVIQAAQETAAGRRKVTHDEVYRQIAEDIAVGRRHPNPQFDKATAEESSARATRAHETRRRRRSGGKLRSGELWSGC